MHCNDVRRLAEACVSGELAGDRRASVAEHLLRCADCRAHVDDVRRLRAAVRQAVASAPDAAPTPAFRAALIANLRADAAARSRPLVSRRSVIRAVAAGAALAIPGLAALLARERTRFRTLAEAAVGDHRFCRVPSSDASQRVSLQAAAQLYDPVDRALGSAQPARVDLSGGPLTEIDRHSCVFGGRRFAHVVLEYRQQRVSLMVTADESRLEALAADAPSRSGAIAMLPAIDGLRVASFRGPRHIAFIVSTLDAAAVSEVAAAFHSSVLQAISGSA